LDVALTISFKVRLIVALTISVMAHLGAWSLLSAITTPLPQGSEQPVSHSVRVDVFTGSHKDVTADASPSTPPEDQKSIVSPPRSAPQEIAVKAPSDRDRQELSQDTSEASLNETTELTQQTAGIRSHGPGAGRVGVNQKAYTKKIAQHLAHYQHYPRVARRRGLQGEVELSISINPSGHVDKAEVSLSSGHSLLDEAALGMVERAQPFPVAGSYGQGELELRVPISFRLR